MTTNYEQRKAMYKRKIADYCLMDDEFFRACMKDNLQAVQLIIRIVLNDDRLVVKSMKIQEDMKNLFGKSSWFDVHAIDKLGRHLDIEIQKASKGAGKERARYYSSLLDANISAPKDDYDKLPDTFMIMFADNDIFKRKYPLYHINRVIAETGQIFNDGSHIIYVNGQYKGSDRLGKLIKDFHEKDAKKIYFRQLRQRADFFKNTKEGVQQMSDDMEKFGNEREAEGKLKNAISFIRAGLTNLDAVIASGQMTPSEIEKIKVALQEN